MVQLQSARGLLDLSVGVAPSQLCAYELSSCPAGTGLARVTLRAEVPSNTSPSWPAVQVAFVVETTLFDGVYDSSAGEAGSGCANSMGGMPCEESNGVPVFIAHAQQIANSIVRANPNSQVSFAMVDYFATCNWDDCDGAEYHVDIPTFIRAADFGSSVVSTFQSEVLGGNWYYGDSDFSDNFLHSSAITALYGTIVGSGLDWSNNTHHVIVWMGSTAPRDPNYPENYCVSPSQYNVFGGGGNCIGSTCEPSYIFPEGASPNCEGWIHSQDGNSTHSIAQLAKTAHQCTGSVGHVCTVDAIDLYDTPTDYLSKDWPKVTGGGPGSPAVQTDVEHILQAGCDIAGATGGTWAGPSWFTCPNGQTGSLQYVTHGPRDNPNLENPTLLAAFRQVGFGPVLETQVAAGTGNPLFTYVPFGSIQPASPSELNPQISCMRGGLTFAKCDTTTYVFRVNGLTYLGWNWSTNATTNVMYIGDEWTASFNVMAVGPPFETVPVDACTTAPCLAGGSGAIDGMFTRAAYTPAPWAAPRVDSFPLATVSVVPTASPNPPATAPPGPLPGPGAPPPPVPLAPLGPAPGIPTPVPAPTSPLVASALGVIAAGLARAGVVRRPLAIRLRTSAGPVALRNSLGG